MKRFQLLIVPMTALMIFATACSSIDSGEPSSKGKSQTTGNEESKIEHGKMKEPVTITFVKSTTPADKTLPAEDTLENNQFTRYLKEKVNVDFKLVWSAAAGEPYDQKVKLSIASNDISDVLIVGEKDLRTLVEADMVQDMTEVFNKYASPLLKSFYGWEQNRILNEAKINGKLLGIPNINPQGDSVDFLWLRKDWLNKLGLKEPKTIDDVADIAKAFIEIDPDGNGKADTVGLPVKGLIGLNAIFNSYHSFPGMWLKDSSGNVFYGSTSQETKQALAKIHEMYATGLIDKEFALRKNFEELYVSGKAGMFFGPWFAPWASLKNAVKNDLNADWVTYMAPIDSKGEYVSKFLPPSSNYLVVKKGFKHPEAVVLALNATIAGERGEDPDAAKLDAKVSPKYWPMRLTVAYPDYVERNHEMLQGAIEGTVKPEALTAEIKTIYDAFLRSQKQMTTDSNEWGPYFSFLVGGQKLRNPMTKVYSIFNSQTPSMERKWANLQKLENEVFLKIIMGDIPINAFDKFLEDWKSQGGNEIVQEITKAIQ